jgi:AcrR family transcriptional regulator
MRRIAEAIEYSPTAIYLHFEDKDDLVRALCHEDFAGCSRPSRGKPRPRTPWSGSASSGGPMRSSRSTNPNHYQFMFMTPRKPEHVLEPSDPGVLSFGVIRAAVKSAIDKGAFRPGDVDTVAQVLWAGVHGAVALLITVRPDCWPAPPAPDLVDQAIEAGIRAFSRTP